MNEALVAESAHSARSERLHVLSTAAAARLLGCRRSEVRRQLRRLLPHLKGQVCLCGGSRIVVTDVGRLALQRVGELEALCLPQREIVSLLKRELLTTPPAPPASPSEAESETEDLEATVRALREEIAQLRAALDDGESEVPDANADAEEENEPLAPSQVAASLSDRFSWTGHTSYRRAARALLAGVGATGAMTIGALAGPLIGLPPMDVPGMLAGFMGNALGPAFAAPVLGWAAHFTIGAALALVYAFLFAERLAGPAVLRGAVYGLVPWLAAQLIVMPVMGAGVFALASGSLVIAANSLLGHVIYGATLGGLYGTPEIS